MYDQFGLEFILRGGPPPTEGGANPFAGAGGMPEGFASFFGGGGMPGGGGGARTFSYGFNFTNPEDLFRDAFRDEKMGGGMGGGMGGMGFEDILFNAARGGAGQRRTARNPFGGGDNMRSARQATPEVTTVERPLPVSLEDLFHGTTKKMKIKRKTFDETGKRTTSDTVLEVPIKPGLKKGSKIRFKGVGDQEEGGQQDLVFVVEEVRINTLPFPHALPI